MSGIRCDVEGCGRTEGVRKTSGEEEDAQGLGRPAIAGVFVCGHHDNWPHSDDAQRFTKTQEYRKRAG